MQNENNLNIKHGASVGRAPQAGRAAELTDPFQWLSHTPLSLPSLLSSSLLFFRLSLSVG